ncbi:hypothetical protein [Hyphobacterium indicum]|uniref:hypothetical protein n=1 Tax=Hyphobacterium indicum TaxID=2162714 RepID=UPI0013753819|nr:hypothetical protein [Hyphobacterium indicum]
MKLMNDTEIAEQLGMSASWVRVQRHKRKHGEDHWLAIDPIYVGERCPRYRQDMFDDFMETVCVT